MARRLLALALLCAAACAPLLASAQDAYRPLADRLTAAQMRETGLDGLSPAQLARLDAILRGEIQTEVAAATEAAERRAEARAGEGEGRRRGGDREAVVSRIAGSFEGWEPGTRFTLANGQVWRVVESKYYLPKSKWVDGPAVSIQPGFVSGFYMQVEGQVPRAKVQRAD